MFRSTTLALMAAALACALCASVASAHPTEPTVPAKIQVGAGHKPFLLAHAIGVQIYACTATADGPKWQFVAPRAVLYGDHFQFLGTHFAGPTWQTKDGSQVKAARVDGVTVDPTAIPWLLLKRRRPRPAGSPTPRTSSASPREAASSPRPRPAAPPPSAPNDTSPTRRTTASGRRPHDSHRHPRSRHRQARPAGHVGERRLRRHRRADPDRRRAPGRQRQPGGRLVRPRCRRRHRQRGDRRGPQQLRRHLHRLRPGAARPGPRAGTRRAARHGVRDRRRRGAALRRRRRTTSCCRCSARCSRPTSRRPRASSCASAARAG